MNIALYGGAFNPPHLAHAAIVKSILTQELVGKIILIPSGRRRDKTSYPIENSDRLRLLQELIQDLNDPRVTIDETFLEMEPEKGSTIAIHELYTQKLGTSPFQIFGSDTIANMPNWFEPERVMHEVPKIIIRRLNDSTSLETITNYKLMPIDFPEEIAILSSTLIRERLKIGDTNGLSPRVTKHIKKYNLYQ